MQDSTLRSPSLDRQDSFAGTTAAVVGADSRRWTVAGRRVRFDDDAKTNDGPTRRARSNKPGRE
jgi:hypothetical protein